jgi:TM2 domain-containing membrane protein YozV
MIDQTVPPAAAIDAGSMKRKAGWSAILLGGLGVHKFLLGYRKAGTIMLVIGIVGMIFLTVPSIIIMLVGITEGIIYITKSDDAFARTYLQGRREWF